MYFVVCGPIFTFVPKKGGLGEEAFYFVYPVCSMLLYCIKGYEQEREYQERVSSAGELRKSLENALKCHHFSNKSKVVGNLCQESIFNQWPVKTERKIDDWLLQVMLI